MILVSATQGRRLFFLCRRLGLLPPPEAAAGAGRRDKRMTIRSDEAAATLAEIERVVAKVKQSRVYRTTALITIVWGVVDLARGILVALWPAAFGPRWFLADLFGVAATIAIPGRCPRAAGGFLCAFSRRSPSSTSSAGSGRTCIGQFGPREAAAFWPMLFLLGFAIAGLLFGAASPRSASASQRSSSPATSGRASAFALWQAAVTGFGFIACGLWMRRS